ncbi:MAG TPA: C40 family peptidase, partial [Alphaproteobacteria bacterium]|nr:C40 family peptidase [Alphaproteobacteria bacterium]
ETALKFAGTPYLWGGRTGYGIDCSGLVQAALLAAGIACPRDTKDQIHIGKDVASTTPPKRGELVFFERHVGIMVDNTRIFNATARTMDARIEKLDDMAAQYQGGILARREI